MRRLMILFALALAAGCEPNLCKDHAGLRWNCDEADAERVRENLALRIEVWVMIERMMAPPGQSMRNSEMPCPECDRLAERFIVANPR